MDQLICGNLSKKSFITSSCYLQVRGECSLFSAKKIESGSSLVFDTSSGPFSVDRAVQVSSQQLPWCSGNAPRSESCYVTLKPLKSPESANRMAECLYSSCN